MTSNAFIKHESPGRLRVSFPEHTYDEKFFFELEKDLREKYPSLTVKSNPVTGSILLTQEEEEGSLKHLLERAAEDGIIELIDAELGQRPTVDVTIGLRRLFRFLDRLIRDFSHGKADIKLVTGLSIIGLGIFQFRAGKVLPAALTLFLNAFAFLEAGRSK
ncbi:MAG: HMA2 domain-containing protein [Oligoflexus sp.]